MDKQTDCTEGPGRLGGFTVTPGSTHSRQFNSAAFFFFSFLLVQFSVKPRSSSPEGPHYPVRAESRGGKTGIEATCV